MEYRKTTEKDIELLMDIRLEMLKTVNDLPENYVFSNELTERSRRYFLDGDQTTVIASENGVIAACASISYIEIMPTFSHPTGRRAHLMNVYTRAGYRRRGIAGKLVQMLIDDAIRKGATEISLDATEAGRPLYESLGFRASDECMVMTLENER